MRRSLVAVFAASLGGFGTIPTPGFVAPVAALTLSSEAFQADTVIPSQYTCDSSTGRVRNAADPSAGGSPALAWRDAPSGVRGWAIVVNDPDAPGGSWIHWIIYNLPPDTAALPEGVPKTETLADGSNQGRNDFRNLGYAGPCPPKGDPPHRYVFTLYALDAKLDLPPTTPRLQLIQAIEKRALAKATLIGRYQR
jgi:hypothetical protein